uniref:Dus domain-containing protein n=1 Tax=Macrostomum lignano TaxID=282301 RepID=A0A1I8G2T7_9PLAT
MVRVGTLPMRLLALDYGADLVYVEEIIDHRLLGCSRLVNRRLGTVDFVHKDGSLVFRTCQRERQRVVLQLRKGRGLHRREHGLSQGLLYKGGMGAALITDAPRAVAILKALVANLSIPVTCKIRVLPNLSDTVALAQALESTGIACLAVHGRFKHERPRNPNHNDYIAAVCRAVSLPVLANGGSGDAVRLPLDVEYFRRVTGASGVMLARAAMHNPSIFRREFEDRLESSETLVVKYLKYAITYDNPFPQSKYCIQQLLHDRTESEVYRSTLAAQTWSDLCTLWNLSAWYGEHLAKVERLEAEAEDASQEQQQQPQSEQHAGVKRKAETAAETALAASGPLTKRRLTVDSDTGEVLASFRYLRRLYRPDTSPKMLLHTHCQWRDLPAPEYKTDYIDRLYYSQVTVEGKVYRNLLGDQSKRYAEQGAACICLVHLGLSDGRKDEEQAKPEQQQQQSKQKQQQPVEKQSEVANGKQSEEIVS